MSIKASYLKPKSNIYFLSPSMAPAEKHLPTIEKSVELLKKLNLNVFIPEIKPFYYMGGTITDRLHQFDDFLEKDYMMATSIVGGKSSNQLIEHLPYRKIATSKKIFLGLSDFTTVLLAVYAQTGLVTFHYSDPAGGMGNNPEWSKKQLAMLFDKDKNYYIKLDKKDFQVIRGGGSKGVILGGNLSALCRLIGTKYCPNFKDAILFLEACNSSLAEVDSMFGQLKMAGILDQISGLVLGSFYQADKEAAEMNFSWEVMLNNWLTNDICIPIIKTNRIGHHTDNIIIPEGLAVALNAETGEILSSEPMLN